MQKPQRGFTLIELLVVIAIIGLLSAVVLASLNQARLRSRDAAAQTQLRELAKLFELQYLETQDYTDLKATGTNAAGSSLTTSGCSSAFTGTYAAKAAEICDAIRSTQISSGYTASQIYVYASGASQPGSMSGGAGKHFSVMARKPSNTAEFFCYGSSGGSYSGPQTPPSTTDPRGNGTPNAAWEGAGCGINP